ncbi:phage adaptor protein [Microbulbifer sp. SSSA005]|uniref:phage adaptor protein n=1 Tax=Microbulbifer sp. SSSA005 TaxID=3243378 RepID=UPI004039E922
MAITNYGELKAAIAGWLERDDLAERLPEFISLAERKIFRKLRTPANERTVLEDRRVDGGDEWLIPTHFLECKRLLVNGVPLSRITDTDYYSRSAQSGQPKYFFRYANRFKVWPAPAEDYRWVLNYWTDMELTEEYPENTVLPVAKDLYLFGALAEAEPYLMNDNRVALWKAKFDEGLIELNDMAERAELAGSASISRGAY